MDATREEVVELNSGNRTADLESLFQAEYAKIARTIARITGDPGRGEELAVEVFLKYSFSSAADRSHAPGWLYRTAIRLALDELRRQTRGARLRNLLQLPPAPLNPEGVKRARDRQNRVSQVLSSQSRRNAELLILRAEGMSYEELAAALSINPASIGTLLSRAQRAFRKEYVRRYGQPE